MATIPAQTLTTHGHRKMSYSFDGAGNVTRENRVETSSLPPSGWYDTFSGSYIVTGKSLSITWTTVVHQNWAFVNDDCSSFPMGPMVEKRSEPETRDVGESSSQETFPVEDGKVLIPGAKRQ